MTVEVNLPDHLKLTQKEVLTALAAQLEEFESDLKNARSYRKYISLQETAHLLSTEANRKRLMEAIDEVNSGNTITYDKI